MTTATSRLRTITAAPHRQCYPGIEHLARRGSLLVLPRAMALLGEDEKQALLKNAGVAALGAVLVTRELARDVRVWSTRIWRSALALVAAPPTRRVAVDVAASISDTACESSFFRGTLRNRKETTRTLLSPYISLRARFFFSQ